MRFYRRQKKKKQGGETEKTHHVSNIYTYQPSFTIQSRQKIEYPMYVQKCETKGLIKGNEELRMNISSFYHTIMVVGFLFISKMGILIF